jgi:hypothetical protein
VPINLTGLRCHDGTADIGLAVGRKTPTATRKREEALHAAIFAALRVRDGKTVVGEGSPARWRLKEIAD